MKDSLSPEEKLLRIIKGDKPPKPANIQAQEISVHKTAPPQAPGLKPALAVRQYLTFENAKRLLPVFFILSFIYLIASFSYPWVGLKKITLPIVTTQEARDLKTESR